MLTYNPSTKGQWSIKVVDPASMAGASCILEDANYDIWMSDMAHEIEEHEPHIEAAQGAKNIAVIGLGLGYYLYQLVHRGIADRITVFEKDQDVIDLFYMATSGISSWDPVHAALTVIHQDVLDVDWAPKKGEFDYVYVDIWLHPGPHQQEDTDRIYAKLSPQTITYWRQ